MSSFGTSGVWSCIVIAGLLAVPMFGWGPLIAAGVISVGGFELLSWANARYHPDGSLRMASPSRKRRK